MPRITVFPSQVDPEPWFTSDKESTGKRRPGIQPLNEGSGGTNNDAIGCRSPKLPGSVSQRVYRGSGLASGRLNAHGISHFNSRHQFDSRKPAVLAFYDQGHAKWKEDSAKGTSDLSLCNHLAPSLIGGSILSPLECCSFPFYRLFPITKLLRLESTLPPLRLRTSY